MESTDKEFCALLRLQIRTLKKALAAETVVESKTAVSELLDHMAFSGHPREPFLYFLVLERQALRAALEAETFEESKALLSELLEDLQNTLED